MGAKETIVRGAESGIFQFLLQGKNILGFSWLSILNCWQLVILLILLTSPNALSVFCKPCCLDGIWIKPDSNLCNMSLSIPKEIRKRHCLYERGNELTIPMETFVLQPQDRIFVTGNRIEIVLFHSNVRPQVVEHDDWCRKNCLLSVIFSRMCVAKSISKVIEVNHANRLNSLKPRIPDLYVVHGTEPLQRHSFERKCQ